ncbi:class I SAM-dependent methyltransferase [Pseudonocardia spinosispora]|uniref:class I SAM-dependent methyltransferase n=1 Tax=Pseudonocardia spinosispora TaxID=103441 RepID=UPI00146FB828|nr:methyltransferase domain-containing protein [Pseudonocardia spinosispora]
MSYEYALSNVWEKASERLSTLEATYDRTSFPRLDTLGIPLGGRCLEVGAGAGSVARHLADRVGPAGSVVATDIDVSLLTDLPPNVEVVEADISTAGFAAETFDVVHTRLVLNHVPARVAALRTLLGLVKVGGRVLLEEGDVFPTDAAGNELHGRVLAGLWAGLGARGADVRFGRELPRLLTETGMLDDIDVTCVVPVSEGGSPGAGFLLGSLTQVEELGPLTDVGDDDLRLWKQLIATPGRWFPGLGLYQVSGCRLASSRSRHSR